MGHDRLWTEPDCKYLVRFFRNLLMGEDNELRNRYVNEILKLLKLRDRKNLMEYYLAPAQDNGLVALLYPDKPRHPRQKYVLTVKGLALLASLI